MVSTQVGPRVKVFSAGDHAHAGEGRPLPNSFGTEAGDLLEFLLEKAGYTKDLEWECRIDKMQHCSPESRPIRIVGFKPFGVSLRVKPKENSTVDQLCTLLIPEGSGYSAKNLFEQLKVNEKSVSRFWRREQKDKPVTERYHIPPPPFQPLPLPQVIQPPQKQTPPNEVNHKAEEGDIAPRPVFDNLKFVYKNKAKLKFVLEKIHALSLDQSIRTKEDFLILLRGQCGWEKFLYRICTRAVNELVKNEYIFERVGDRNKIIGYMLTEKGLAVTGGTYAVKPAVIAPLDFSKILIEARAKAQELADAGARLEMNRDREIGIRAEIQRLQEEIKQIHEENQRVAKVISNSKEAYDLLNKVMGLITPLPLEGVRSAELPQGTPVKG